MSANAINEGNPTTNGLVQVDVDREDRTLGAEIDRGADEWLERDFLRGNANNDAVFDISDVVYLLASLFTPGSPPLVCPDAGDGNDDGGVDVSDAVYLLAALFTPGAPAPAAPYPDCGSDPTLDSLMICGEATACP